MPANFRGELRKSCTVETRIQLRLDENRPYLTVFGDSELLAFQAESEAKAQAARARGEDFDQDMHDMAFFVGIDEVNLDGAGRFAIPREVRESAGISDAIFFTGANRVIQLWDPQRFLDLGPKNSVIDGFCRKFMAEVEAKRRAKA
ncbi:hypothetical protein [Sphingobium nicotianae]|uniref:SpoVT-AbrB domain-containing protein n=1 Tax=Sphingobium nicotianae TaxID=2782607 RepID=A0A9X1ISB9_9SPHN|nr:hypothetical protein [Sphingobium nicotianae]MBT2188010.1 hypothetical protein [Sphingobium nicotianae]